ncbi:MAG: TIGR04282 family arsenosugar biosynthesis glycosyltransferase [Gammaproteobacteria bacterium]|nr:TIGR04282 family arsenosugar biosynthesis glycosyltransferase [Gammaproteobacteria bacterium]
MISGVGSESYLFPDSRIIIFAKAPVAGKSKTRLVPALNQIDAAAFAAQLICHSVKKIAEANLCPVELCCSPDISHPVFKDMQQQYKIELTLQAEGDLGTRMASTFNKSLRHAQSVILIGTDCPIMDRKYISEALSILDAGSDIVFGPVEDGGYVLVGLNHVCNAIFQGVDWGTEQVMAQTRDIMNQYGYSWKELPTLWDVDRPEDVERAIAILADT